jgi:hypothetical protein
MSISRFGGVDPCAHLPEGNLRAKPLTLAFASITDAQAHARVPEPAGGATVYWESKVTERGTNRPVSPGKVAPPGEGAQGHGQSWRRVFAALHEAIASGAVAPGTWLPSEAELGARVRRNAGNSAPSVGRTGPPRTRGHRSRPRAVRAGGGGSLAGPRRRHESMPPGCGPSWAAPKCCARRSWRNASMSRGGPSRPSSCWHERGLWRPLRAACGSPRDGAPRTPTKRQDVHGRLSGAIATGQLPVGARVQSEIALSRQYGVARATVRRALGGSGG